MLYRKNILDLINWKQKENTALLVKGARQVGKTRLIEEFIQTNFSNIVEIDFTKDTNALNLLLEISNYDDFINRISLISKVDFRNNDAVIFLDEIQYYYEAREKRIKIDPSIKDKYIDLLTLSKEIVNKNEFRLIFSGSMLGTTLFNINLNPVGYLKTITMYPMDFEEFLLANNVNENTINELKEYFKNKVEVPQTLNQMMLDKYREYILVGGMPKAVEGYVLDKSFSSTSTAQENIYLWYKEDIIKYSNKEDRLIILEIYNLLTSELTNKNKKFVKSHLDVPNFKNLDLKDRFLWLKAAGITIPVYNVSNPIYPLKISVDYKIVKLFFNDVGLLSNLIFDQDAKRKIVLGDYSYNLGPIYENAVTQELQTHGFESFYYSNKKGGEIDFIIESNMNVNPIEIKSGKPNSKGIYSHNALNNFLKIHSEVKEGFLFGINNIKKENDNITMFPIYMIDFLIKK